MYLCVYSDHGKDIGTINIYEAHDTLTYHTVVPQLLFLFGPHTAISVYSIGTAAFIPFPFHNSQASV